MISRGKRIALAAIVAIAFAVPAVALLALPRQAAAQQIAPQPYGGQIQAIRRVRVSHGPDLQYFVIGGNPSYGGRSRYIVLRNLGGVFGSFFPSLGACGTDANILGFGIRTRCLLGICGIVNVLAFCAR